MCFRSHGKHPSFKPTHPSLKTLSMKHTNFFKKSRNSLLNKPNIFFYTSKFIEILILKISTPKTKIEKNPGNS